MDKIYLCIRKIYNINILFFLNNIIVRRDLHFSTSKQNPIASSRVHVNGISLSILRG